MKRRVSRMSLVFFICLVSAAPRTNARRIVTLVTIHGNDSWNTSCVLGDSPQWRLVPHTLNPTIFTDLMLGFDEEIVKKASSTPSIPGQGSILDLARDEGWITAFFSSRDSTYDTVFIPVHERVESWTELEPGFRNWDKLNEMHGVWLASHDMNRFSWIHISLTDLSSRDEGSAELYEFWIDLDTTLESLSDEYAIFAIYIPSEYTPPWDSTDIPVGSFRGSVVVPPENLVLSTLDIAPTIAYTMRFINTPDYYGQSLALWKRIERRVEPIPLQLGNLKCVQGTRIIALTNPVEDDQSSSRIRFYDLWKRSFTMCNQGDPECNRLAGLLLSPKKFTEQLESSVSSIQGTIEENGE